jgi:hypothetical protein
MIVLLVGLLFLGASAIQQNAWNQGFMMGQLAASGQDGTITPYLPYMMNQPGGSSFFRVLFGLGLIFLLAAVVARFLRPRAWRGAGGGDMERWAKHWHRHHGPRPPWCWEEEEPAEEPAGHEQEETSIPVPSAEGATQPQPSQDQ